MTGRPSRRRLYRDSRRAWLAGVCAGIADYFGVSPAAVRLLVFLSALFFTFPTVLGYLVASFVLAAPAAGHVRQRGGGALLALGAARARPHRARRDPRASRTSSAGCARPRRGSPRASSSCAASSATSRAERAQSAARAEASRSQPRLHRRDLPRAQRTGRRGAGATAGVVAGAAARRRLEQIELRARPDRGAARRDRARARALISRLAVLSGSRAGRIAWRGNRRLSAVSVIGRGRCDGLAATEP